MRSIAPLAVAIVLTSLVASAQVQERITVSVVEVPVTVVDRAGNPIRGLTAANFELLDDGKSRPVTSVDAIDFASKASITAISPLNPAARRNFMLLFDLSFASPSSLSRAQQASRDFVAKMVEPRDRVAVATIDAEKGFKLVTAFTTDRKLIADAIGNPLNYRGSDPLQIAGTVAFGEQAESTGLAPSGREQRDAIATAEFNDTIRRANKVEDQFNRGRVEREINLLAGLAKTLRSINGQKHVVLLSEGFDPRLVQGREAQASGEQLRENAAVEHGEIWNVDTDARFGSASSMSLLDRLTDVARRSDVLLHAIDIKGVRVDVDAASGTMRKSSEGLNMLALATGGTVFKNANEVSSDFARLMKQQEVVYVLAFQAPTSSPGKFHKLKVRLVSVPGGRVTARSGYYEAGAETVAERSLSNAEVVLNDIPQGAVHIDALVAPFATTATNAQVPVILEISGPDLIASAKGDSVTAEVFVYAFDEQGFVRDSLFQRLSFDLAKVGATLKTSGMKYYGTLSLPPGKYAVKTLVRAVDLDRKGFVRTDIVVPQPGDMAVSQPFFFEPAGRWLMVKGGSHDKTNSAYPFEVSGQTFIPSVAVRMTKGEPRTFAVFVQNASPDELAFETNVKSTVVKQVKSATGTKIVLQLEPVEPSTPTLNVTVRKKGSADARTSSVPLLLQ